MFGDKKLVLVRGGGGQVARAAGDYLAAPAKAALVVIETGALRPSALSASWPKAMTRPWRFPALRPMHAKFRN